MRNKCLQSGKLANEHRLIGAGILAPSDAPDGALGSPVLLLRGRVFLRPHPRPQGCFVGVALAQRSAQVQRVAHQGAGGVAGECWLAAVTGQLGRGALDHHLGAHHRLG